MKYFYRNEWQLGGDWENTNHVFGAPDSDTQVEQTEKSIAASLEISDDEQDMVLSSHSKLIEAEIWV